MSAGRHKTTDKPQNRKSSRHGGPEGTKPGSGLSKGDVVTLDITALSSDGAGIGRYGGLTLFVKRTVPGDCVRAQILNLKKSYGFAKLVQVIRGSEARVRPECACADKCGGCQIMQMTYSSQLAAKETKVRDALTRIGGLDLTDVDFSPILGMDDPHRYRNKEQVPVGIDAAGNPVFGFYAEHSHRIVPMPGYDCLLGSAGNAYFIKAIRSWILKYKIPVYSEQTHTGLIRHVLIRTARSGETLVCLVAASEKIPHIEALVKSLQDIGASSVCLNVQPEPNNVILGRRTVTLAGSGYITDTIGDIRFRVSPNSFFQVNRDQTEKLYGKALEFAGLTGGETVWDLYCGIGTISLFLAQKAAKVYGVEIVPQAVEDARANALANGFANATFFTGEAEKIVPEFYREKQAALAAGETDDPALTPDVMVVDPPRKGCDPELLDTMIQMHPDRIVYVSCDPATLARDLKILTQAGFRLKRVQPVDMFPETMAVETVTQLTRIK
ncbi:MAG: 23S rRNA (uracil(1939)-C(5))-methyltransferase RlmD [Lachnospiraceae bacterium]|jgi:23S rRNA (uracil1939-C5)-methyltransferase